MSLLSSEYPSHDNSHFAGIGSPCVLNVADTAPDINEMQAQLQAQLLLPLKVKTLDLLRKQHKLPTYYRTSAELRKCLESHMCSSACVPSPSLLSPKRKIDDLRSDDLVTDWPLLVGDDEKKNITRDYLNDTSTKSLSFSECSFCGCSANTLSTRRYSVEELDISLLIKARSFLRDKLDNVTIEIAELNDKGYVVCSNCQTCIKRKSFFHIPLYSYANGCWLGTVPEELRNLTLLEEMCIARARTTRCTVKLSPGKFSQYATHGNVCVFPQEPRTLPNVLPPPINSIFDEIAVIFVSSNEVTITEDMLNKSPLLVRRGRVLKALLWLKMNNPFYRETEISMVNLNSYPEDGAPTDCPVQYVLDSSAEGGGYTMYNTESNSTLLGTSDASLTQSCCVLDTDRQESSYNLRKVDMVKEILNKRPFVKYPIKNNEPLRTSYNPSMYAQLWPTLFPYGIGLFEDEVRLHKSAGMRILDLKRHVNHVLNMVDSRFQKHIVFPFVIMNIIQRKVSSFKSKLILKRSWFPKVIEAMKHVDIDSLDEIKSKFLSKTPLGDSLPEKSVQTLLKYVNYISEDVSGSIGEVNKMRYEIRSIMRSIGLPQLFITINPADTYNPIMQVFGGRDIDLSKSFHDLVPLHEDFERMKCSVSNPSAAARAFDKIISSFVDIILGMKRRNNIGVFGRTRSYYGVVEAQGRGSLHCHFFVWLEDALDPFQINEKLKSDEQWKSHFFEWLENCIQQDLPENTDEYEPPSYSKLPLMCRPCDIDFTSTESRAQDLRNVLQLTGQIHKHSETCYKHLPFVVKSQRDDDADCRFGLPRETVKHTYLDDEGHIHIRCRNGYVNGYNDIIVSCLRCNMDCKFIGSGTAALAMTEYVTNYIAKISLDSSIIFSCLCAALKSMKNLSSSYSIPDDDDDVGNKARLLLLKICNGMIGKRELSGQQVSSFLQNIPNRYNNHLFETFWWTTVLKYVSPVTFGSDDKDNEQYVVLKENMLSSQQLHEDSIPSIIADYVYRPAELREICLWDFWCNFRTVKYKSDSGEDQGSDSDSSNKGKSRETYHFTHEHPKSLSYMIAKRKLSVTPILSGIQIPRDDIEDDLVRYHIAMLTLFKPWSETRSCLLKEEICSWKSTFDKMYESMTEKHRLVLRNFQSIHSCKDAAHDFSTVRRKRLKTLVSNTYDVDGDNERIASSRLKDDMDWVNAMQSDDIDESNENVFDLGDVIYSKSTSSTVDGISCAENGGFYQVTEIIPMLGNFVKEGSEMDITHAENEDKRLLYLKEQLRSETSSTPNDIWPVQSSDRNEGPIQVNFNLQDPPPIVSRESLWVSLLPHRKLCVHIINKFTLNDEQAITFLLFTDHYGLQYCINPPVFKDPLRLIVSGPGGTGKSQIFHAIRYFFDCIGHNKRLMITAPTGLAANTINGTTVHSEASLRIAPQKILAGSTGRINLEKRYQNITAQIVDEIYFLSAGDNAILSQNLGLASSRRNGDSPYGNLNMILAGDPAQLPPPNANPLFDWKLVKKAETSVNAQHGRAKLSLSGVIIWRQISDCIVLSKIMRQKDEGFQNILGRLRFGNCTEDDYDKLSCYVIGNRSVERNRELLSIGNWLHIPSKASPLITYTNILRDIHNMRSCEAFALHTGQEFFLYHSTDKVERGKIILSNQAAQAAWNIPVKEADDLAGRLPLIPGMPIFLTQNIATELGLSNGSSGTLISCRYLSRNGLRYAISVEVDIEKYTHGTGEHPHRVTLKPYKSSITFRLPGREKEYSAKRYQIPIIPAFAYTAHNSQSRSVESACIDLESCRSTAAAYVMLSRLKSLDGLSILRPFSYVKISRHCPEEVREEVKRLQVLSDSTKEKSRESLKWYYDITTNQSTINS